LAVHLDAAGAGYLIAFSDFYPRMIVGREIIFTAEDATGEANGIIMTIYRWK
jgi:hypothetical protein